MQQDFSLRRLLTQQLAAYPQAEPIDLFKLLYQNEFGCGHLLGDPAQGLERLRREAEALRPEAPASPVEPIGGGLCRLHLRVLAQQGLAVETLWRMFVLSARPRGSREGFREKTDALEALCRDGTLPVSAAEIRRLTEQWTAEGCNPFSHSDSFRRYAPAYRVVEERFCAFLPLFCQIDRLRREKAPVLVALDGNCAAGKTTLAALLGQVYDCAVLSMDDFFLRPEQRTPERLAEPGGNVDRERFAAEVLTPLQAGRAFSYRPYCCARQALGAPRDVAPGALTVVEGSYALHPALADAYDLRVFLSVPPEEQLRRIRRRNPDKLERFRREWIPLEERYFAAFSIPQHCDLVFSTGEANCI